MINQDGMLDLLVSYELDVINLSEARALLQLFIREKITQELTEAEIKEAYEEINNQMRMH